MKSFLTWILSLVVAGVIVAGIVFQATHPGLYNLAHFLAIAGGVLSIIVLPLLFLGFTVGQDEAIKRIMSDETSKANCLKTRPFGFIRRTFGLIWSAFFIVLYASQGWYIVAFMFLISCIVFQLTIPHWNQAIRKVQGLIELEK